MMEFATWKELVNPDNKPYHLLGFGNDRQAKEAYFGVPELYLKICWIKENQQSLVFVTLDTLYFSAAFTTPLFETARATCNLQQHEIIFNASHTHSAPNISMPHWDYLNTAYIGKVQASFAKGLKWCAANMQNGSVAVNQILPSEKLFLNRRKKTITPTAPFSKRVERLPNYKAPIDNHIRTITLYDMNGKADTILYNFACHPVFNRNENFSSDFIGEVSQKLEEKVSTAMFLQGFCGDVRVNYTGKPSPQTLVRLLTDTNHLKRNLSITAKLLFYGEIFIPYTKECYSAFVSRIVNYVEQAALSAQHKTTTETLQSHTFKSTLHTQQGRTSKTFSTTLVKYGRLLMVSIPAEVNSCYYNLLAGISKQHIFFPLGYGYDMIAYLPGSEEVKDGGYEVNSFDAYDLDTPFAAESLQKYEIQLTEQINSFLTVSHDA